jgi:hypothetical protein
MAAPVGICLHSPSPETPADKIECFEFERVEKITGATRFFLENGRSVVITTYKARGVVLYPQQGGNPANYLADYEAKARGIPSTRRFLNPWILKIRGSVADRINQAEERAKLPSITLPDGIVLKGCKVTLIEGDLISVTHADGIKKIWLTNLSEESKESLGLKHLLEIDKKHWDLLQRAQGSRNPEEAAKVYRQLAERGYAKAQYELGNAYMSGNGVPEDPVEAVRLLKMATDQGHIQAQSCLSYAYQYEPVVRDLEESFRLALDCAERNWMYASEVAEHYKDGVGVPRNVVLAFMWYDIENEISPGSSFSTPARMAELSGEMTISEVTNARDMSRAYQIKIGFRPKALVPSR